MPRRVIRLGDEVIGVTPTEKESAALDALGTPWSGRAAAVLSEYLGRRATVDSLRDELGEPLRTRVLAVLLDVVGHEPWLPDLLRVRRARRALASCDLGRETG